MMKGKKIVAPIETQAEAREACRQMGRTRSAAHHAELKAALAEAEKRAVVPCGGEAHANAHIDNCPICAPWWACTLPR